MSKATIQERRDYLKEKVNPILEVMVSDLMKERPANVIEYIGQWVQAKGSKVQSELERRNQNSRPAGVQSSDSESSSDDEEFIAKPQKKMQQRTSVSAEAFGLWNKKEDFKPKFVKKTSDQIERITKRLNQSFMFSELEDKEKDMVIGAMEEVHFRADAKVITQGEDGDVLYVVDAGLLDCFKRFAKDGQNSYLKTYTPGESFGELALLYNAPRAASIVCKENAICFTLDRACFNNIVKDAAVKKRERYEEFINTVPILKSLDSYERSKICDCLQTQKYEEGELVIKEGDNGNTFFLVEEGSAIALKNSVGGGTTKVFEYGKSDYFGELALLKDQPRAASIKATSSLKVAWIDRLSFKRVLGPLETILERNTDRYAQFMKEKGILN